MTEQSAPEVLIPRLTSCGPRTIRVFRRSWITEIDRLEVVMDDGPHHVAMHGQLSEMYANPEWFVAELHRRMDYFLENRTR